jgi:hypothetical protein
MILEIRDGNDVHKKYGYLYAEIYPEDDHISVALCGTQERLNLEISSIYKCARTFKAIKVDGIGLDKLKLIHGFIPNSVIVINGL